MGDEDERSALPGPNGRRPHSPGPAALQNVLALLAIALFLAAPAAAQEKEDPQEGATGEACRPALAMQPGATWTGECVDGKAEGPWTIKWASGNVWKGECVAGKEHGPWTMESPGGSDWEGPFKHGKRHGHWIMRWADGTVFEGPYVEGKEHGVWITRDTDGYEEKTLYLEGKVQPDEVP